MSPLLLRPRANQGRMLNENEMGSDAELRSWLWLPWPHKSDKGNCGWCESVAYLDLLFRGMLLLTGTNYS